MVRRVGSHLKTAFALFLWKSLDSGGLFGGLMTTYDFPPPVLK